MQTYMYIRIVCFKRILLYGVIRTIRPLGPLDGLLGGRFIVAFLSVLCLILAKGVFIAIVVVALPLSSSVIIVGMQFIPQIMLALFTTIGFSWSSMKLILHHPEAILLVTLRCFDEIRISVKLCS